MSKKNDYSYNTKNIKYNFNCLQDNKNICKFLKKELYEAVNSISDIIDRKTPAKFEAFVDDLSKYRVDTSKETLAVLLNSTFEPINTSNSFKDNNIISPYPNSEALLNKINKGKKDNDFILVLNNFKSDKKYLKDIRNDFDSSIIMEIFDGLKVLEMVEYPYIGNFSHPAEELVPEFYMPKRKNFEIMEADAKSKTDMCLDIVNHDKLNTVIHWEDTLITKEKSTKKPAKKCSTKKLNRIVAAGDIHGDYEHLISILRHAKLIDRKNNWIGMDTILVQLGDLVDRGNSTRKIYDTLIDIREQAQKKGGIVYMLYGNHDVMAIQGNHIYTTEADYESFGGIQGFEEAFSPKGKYGQYLRKEMNLTVTIDDTLFVHTGIVPAFAELGIEELNRRAREVLLNTPSVPELEKLYNQNITHPIYTEPILNLLDNPDKGPLWSRFFSDNPESVICEKVDESLKLLNVKRMIVGHAVQAYGKITTKCQNKLIFTDIGISRCINSGGYYGYLEILETRNGKETWARYFKKN